MQLSSAPTCLVIGCDHLSALTDTARGRLFTVRAHYCSDCYRKLLEGEQLPLDLTRLALEPVANPMPQA